MALVQSVITSFPKRHNAINIGILEYGSKFFRKNLHNCLVVTKKFHTFAAIGLTILLRKARPNTKPMGMKNFSSTDIETIVPARDTFNQFQIIVPADKLSETGLDHILGGSQMQLLDCDCTGQNSNQGTGQCECPWTNENVSDVDPQKAKPSNSCSCIFANANGVDAKKNKKGKK